MYALKCYFFDFIHTLFVSVGQVENVLKNSSPEEFLSKYGRPKPDINFPLVFSCQSGKRSLIASETAVKLGYKK